MDRIDALRLFQAVAELESFTRAAERHSLTPGAASKQISALEERMQARLLERTTRLAADNAAAAGFLRVAAPVDFGSARLIEPVTAFMEQWPSVEVRLDLSDRMVDLVDEGYDLAVRLGHLPDSSLIAKRLADAPMTTIASAAWLEAEGRPAHPSDLARHACIIDRNRPAPNLWRFEKDGVKTDVKVDGRLSLNGASAAVAAACAGAGVACVPSWAARAAIADGRVVSLMDDWTPEARELWAVFPSNRYLAHRVRLFVDFLAGWFKGSV